MQIRAEIQKLLPGGAQKAVADVILDDVFVIHNVIAVEGHNGRRFILMPPFDPRMKWKKRQRDVCHPLTKELRMRIQSVVFDAYDTQIKALLTAGKQSSEGGEENNV